MKASYAGKHSKKLPPGFLIKRHTVKTQKGYSPRFVLFCIGSGEIYRRCCDIDFKINQSAVLEAYRILIKETKEIKGAYYMRNLPCILNGKEMPYSVSGNSTHMGSGVLEWCLSYEDAEWTLSLMQKDHRFSNLSIRKTGES